MSKQMGVWISHSQAIVVALSIDGKPSVQVISSGVAGRRKSYGFEGRPAEGQVHGSPQRKLENRRQNELSRFYRAVIKALSATSEILILGSGPAKREFLSEAEANRRLAACIVAVKTVDRMTRPQLVAYVKEFFERRGAKKTRRRQIVVS